MSEQCFIIRLNALKIKYNIEYCVEYKNIEKCKILASLVNDLDNLIKHFTIYYDFKQKCISTKCFEIYLENNLNHLEKYLDNLFIIDQSYINNLSSGAIDIIKNTYIVEDIVIPSNLCINVGANDLIINGQYKTITVKYDSLNNKFKGLIKNGDYSNSGKDNIIVKNIIIDGKTNSIDLYYSSAWICKRYFGHGVNTQITNCYSNGDINNYFSGGICGSNAGKNGYILIEGCYSSGNINGFQSGGICGSMAGESNGKCEINNCYSLGEIGDSTHATNIGQGGICGNRAGYLCKISNSGCFINNCYSIGDIVTHNVGGICGQLAGFHGNCIINNCYSTGNIYNDPNNTSGGMCGFQAGYNGVCIINNCYSIQETGNNSADGITPIDGNDLTLLINVPTDWDTLYWKSIESSYPILKIFENLPWHSKYYKLYTDLAKFKL